MSFLDEFMEFLHEYGVIGLAVAFVIGLAVKDLVGATVEDLIMPIIGVVLPTGNWQDFLLVIGSIELRVGHFLGALIDFVIIALLVFIFVRYGLGKEKVDKI